MTNYTNFEKELKSAIKVEEPDGAYRNRLHANIQERELNMLAKPKKTRFKGWAFAASPILILIAVVLMIGPNKVLAQIQSWLGFTPEVGFLEKDAEIWTLNEPIKLSQEKVEWVIENAWFTPEKSVVKHYFYNVPEPVFYKDMVFEQCHTPAWLETEDGTRYEEIETGIFPAIPAGIKTLSLHVPCIKGTLIDNTAPQNWQTSLGLVLAKGELAIQDAYSLQDVAPDAQIIAMEIERSDSENPTDTVPSKEEPDPMVLPQPDKAIDGGVQIQNVVVHGDALILAGTFSGTTDTGELYLQGSLEIRDADGRTVPYRLPEDYKWLVPFKDYNFGMHWAIEFRPTGFKAPFTIKQLASTAKQIDKPLDFEIQNDAFVRDAIGDFAPSMRVANVISRSIDDLQITLITSQISTESINYAYFYTGSDVFKADISQFDPASQSFVASTKKESRPSDFVDRGWFGAVFEKGISLDEEKYIYRLSNAWVVDETFELRTDWTPDETLLATLGVVAGKSGAIVSYESFQMPEIEMENIPDGMIISGSQSGKEVVLKNLKGETLKTLDTDYAGLSLDGKRIVYPEGKRHYGSVRTLSVMDLESGEVTEIDTISDNYVHMPRWSPNGDYLAYRGNKAGFYVYRMSDKTLQYFLPNAKFEILGWSHENEIYVFEYAYGDVQGKLVAYEPGTGRTNEIEVSDIAVWGTNYALMSRYDGQLLAINAIGDELYVMDPKTQQKKLIVEGYLVNSYGWFDQNIVIVTVKKPGMGPQYTLLINIQTDEVMRIPVVPGVPYDVSAVK